MLEIHAVIVRGQTFIAGETLTCTVTFTNSSPVSADSDEEPVSKTPETLGWATAQIHCFCTVNKQRVKPPLPVEPTHPSATYGQTSFNPTVDEKGASILVTKPSIIVCDLSLLPGESKSVDYTDTIPYEAPPSYSGQLVRYSYKVVIGCQRPGGTTKFLRIPFRVLLLYGLGDTSVYKEQPETNGSSATSSINDVTNNSDDRKNPFLKGEEGASLLDCANHILELLTNKMSTSTYAVSNEKGNICSFSLPRVVYKIGEDINGFFDFALGTVPCVQYVVVLQSEETVASEAQVGVEPLDPGVTSHCRLQEGVWNVVKTHFCMSVPLTVCPAFMSDCVALRWKLHFEFTVVAVPAPKETFYSQSESSQGVLYKAPSSINVETMSWDLPVKIVATNPLVVNSCMIGQVEHSLVI